MACFVQEVVICIVQEVVICKKVGHGLFRARSGDL